eukprot:3475726-Rhodomonas_salina.1
MDKIPPRLPPSTSPPSAYGLAVLRPSPACTLAAVYLPMQSGTEVWGAPVPHRHGVGGEDGAAALLDARARGAGARCAREAGVSRARARAPRRNVRNGRRGSG